LKTTTVLITHNVSIAAMGDRVISFTNGHIADIRLNAQRRPAGELSW
jgi:putative ABC transport system ATP-binding protein